MSEKEESTFIKEATLMSDWFFELCACTDGKYIQEIVNTIFSQLGFPSVTVESVEAQQNQRSVVGRSARLDVLAKDAEGNLLNIEIQQSRQTTLAGRARYYASMIDTNNIGKKVGYEELPKTFVIFITDWDYLNEGEAAYVCERMFRHSHKPANDGSYIIYVNGSYRENDPIGRLMEDFHCQSADKMSNPVLAERVKFFKEDPEGRKQLMNIEEKVAAKAEARGILKGEAIGIVKGEAIGIVKGEAKKALEVARNLLGMELSLEEIAKACNLPLEDVRKIQQSELAHC